mmetsp:Transcript_48195/g.148713  ORF Transcript_48195/g.148713 Transcript_48195/m.148713 type:complete len:524 (-) Transcript_48195:122-1693(-)
MALRRIQKEVRAVHDAICEADSAEDGDNGAAPALRLQVSELCFPGDHTVLVVTVDPPPFNGSGESRSAFALPHPNTFWAALVGVRLKLHFEFPSDFPFKQPRLRITPSDLLEASAQRRPRAFGPLPVGSHELDPAPWQPPVSPSDSPEIFKTRNRPLADDELGGYFSSIALVQQSLRFRLELLHETVTRIMWRALLDVGWHGLRVHAERLESTEARSRAQITAEETAGYDRIRDQFRRATESVARVNPSTLDHMLRSSAAPQTEAGSAALRTLIGQTYMFPLRGPGPDHEETTVEDLRAFAAEKTGCPADQMRLIASGKQLHDGHRSLSSDYGVRDGHTVHMVIRLRGCGHNNVLVPGGDKWSPALTLDRHILPRLNTDLYCFDVGADLAGNTCTAFTCISSMRLLMDEALALLGQVEGVASILPGSVDAHCLSNGCIDMPSGLFGSPEHAADRAQLFDAMQWVLRAASPSPLVRWTPETDRFWPLLFRKMIRYLRRVRLGPAYEAQGRRLPLEVVERVGEFL